MSSTVSSTGARSESGATPDEDYSGRRVVILGLGTFGGGAACVEFFHRCGAKVRVSDTRTAEQLRDAIEPFRNHAGIEWVLGEQSWEQVADAELVVVNPAIRWDHPLVNRLREAGIPLTTEMSLFWQRNRGQVIAVTGSNGKSTTTALIHFLLEARGHRAWLGGNIGRSLLLDASQILPDDYVVLEVSSFQLHWLNELQARPRIAVVTGFDPNHLDWHGTLEHYRCSKQHLLRWQTESDWCVLNDEDPEVGEWPSAAQRVCVSRDAVHAVVADTLDLSTDGLRLRGVHNQLNARLALAAAQIAESQIANAVPVSSALTPQPFRECLVAFNALPHRLQWVADVQGRSFYEDSIATTPESAIAGLASFNEPIVLLAGGYDKHLDLNGLAQAAANRCRAVVLMGQTGPELGRLIEQHASPGSGPELIPSASFPASFAAAWQASRPGDVVLLSPGCASYDWFTSYVQRGDLFQAMVRELARAAD